MIKLFFLILFFCIGPYALRADELMSDEQQFMEKLAVVKDPFEAGLPKPIVVAPKPVPPPRVVKPHVEKPKPKPKPKPVAPAVIELPELHLQGVVVGEDIPSEAIIDDQDIAVGGSIKGARIISIEKDKVWLLYKSKKFFLKVD